MYFNIKAKKAFKEGIGNKSFNNNTINVGGLGKSPIRGFMRMKDDSEPTGGPFPRFCGGKSKPYKK